MENAIACFCHRPTVSTIVEYAKWGYMYIFQAGNMRQTRAKAKTKDNFRKLDLASKHFCFIFVI